MSDSNTKFERAHIVVRVDEELVNKNFFFFFNYDLLLGTNQFSVDWTYREKFCADIRRSFYLEFRNVVKMCHKHHQD